MRSEHAGMPPIRVPEIDPQNGLIVIIGTPERVTSIFGNPQCMSPTPKG